MRSVLFAALACLLGLLTGLACEPLTGGFPTIAFTCDPGGPLQPACPDRFNCCSDDGTSIAGFALFSDVANDRSHSGMCVNAADIPRGSGLDNDCPIPCNPLWLSGRIDEACGQTRSCCQTRALVEADCIFDEAEGLWVPMDGRDAEAALLAGKARWGEGTHQDPEFEGCEALAGGRNNALFLECVRSLTVADQRGYCMALMPGALCPTAEDAYIDACEAMNE